MAPRTPTGKAISGRKNVTETATAFQEYARQCIKDGIKPPTNTVYSRDAGFLHQDEKGHNVLPDGQLYEVYKVNLTKAPGPKTSATTTTPKVVQALPKSKRAKRDPRLKHTPPPIDVEREGLTAPANPGPSRAPVAKTPGVGQPPSRNASSSRKSQITFSKLNANEPDKEQEEEVDELENDTHGSVHPSDRDTEWDAEPRELAAKERKLAAKERELAAKERLQARQLQKAVRALEDKFASLDDELDHELPSLASRVEIRSVLEDASVKLQEYSKDRIKDAVAPVNSKISSLSKRLSEVEIATGGNLQARIKQLEERHNGMDKYVRTLGSNIRKNHISPRLL